MPITRGHMPAAFREAVDDDDERAREWFAKSENRSRDVERIRQLTAGHDRLAILIVPELRGELREEVIKAVFEQASVIAEWPGYGMLHIIKNPTPPKSLLALPAPQRPSAAIVKHHAKRRKKR